MKQKILTVACILTFTYTGMKAKVWLPHLISNGMVVQQQSQAQLWGKAKAGKTVKVTTTWTSQTYTTKADKDGKWTVKVATPKADFKQHSIVFDDGDTTRIDNVLIGEVWVAGGQSNMEMPIGGFGNCPVEGYNDVVADAANVKGVRYVKIPSVISEQPAEDANCQWKTISPETVDGASATGYFFARLVNRTLHVPVGVIEANKGGSRVESWLNKANIEKYTDEPTTLAEIKKRIPHDPHYPMVWYNGTFHPIVNYTVRGILFYQGCTNVDYPNDHYAERLAALASQWRQDFGRDDIPFYYVEIAPFWYGDSKAARATKVRDQQAMALKLIPNSGMVGTNDAVYPWEQRQIHPCQKQKVGERLAMMALNRTYGLKKFVAENPMYESMTVEGNTAYVKLKNLHGGVNRLTDIEGFEVAGEDKVFHKVTGYYDEGRKAVVLKCKEVEKPVAVRYCYRNFELGNFANQGGWPLLQFRTDNWNN